MHDDRILVENRIDREFRQRLVPHAYSATRPLSIETWDAPGEPVTHEEAQRQSYRRYHIGEPWSRPWGTTWFRLAGDVPPEWVGGRIEAVIDLGFDTRTPGFQAEGLVWTAHGPLQGIHPRRTAVLLPSQRPGPMSMMVEAASNPALGEHFAPTPMGSLATAGDRPLYCLARAELAVRDDDVFALLLDIEVLRELMLALPITDPRRAQLLRTLERAFNTIDMQQVSASAAAARVVLQPALQLPARASSMHVVGVGHAHIDSAWLWPLRETARKCARTFASAVRLMDEYPEYRFVCSQAAQYEWIEHDHPALFERIREKVTAGQFIPVGGMWVEADMNLPSGESIVRQLVQGQRYFESRFGLRCREVWIPDVFGYPASLPQVFAAAGCARFITQKLSWNKQNKFPHNTFWWEGLDGTRVLTHFPPVDTYNAEFTPTELVFSEHHFRDHGWSRWALMPYGYGNGGGGPTIEMVERARRMADVDGLPRVTLGTPDEFFEHLEHEAACGAPVPVWQGELYFEMHRGTLTSQIETKLGNRRCERLLREAELWWAAVGRLPAVVADEVSQLWRDVLLQQFHDILPGSSIAWVHADAEGAHARIAARLEALISEAFECLGVGGPFVANVGTHFRHEVVVSSVAPSSPGLVQVLSSGEVALAVAIAGSALAPLTVVDIDGPVVTADHSMSNGLLTVRWDGDGRIVSIVDVARDRQLLPRDCAVTLEIAPDHPVEYDAWDLEAWTPGLGGPLDDVTSVRFVEQGPLLAQLRVERSFGKSSAVTTYGMRAGSARLDIDFDVDWHEDEKLLSLMVPLEVRTASAKCDIQFGHVSRPTHASSSLDAAKFEVCAHRWVDVAEPSFGVAVLNDGRFGHRLLDGGVRVSLLRAAKFPDPTADHGRHRVTIAILPHGPGLHEVLAEAEALNMPLRLVGGKGNAPVPAPVVTLDNPGVMLSAVKRADDDSGDLVVRLYEACGDRATVTVRAARPITFAFRANIFEETLMAIDTVEGVVPLRLRPFELVTLRLTS